MTLSRISSLRFAHSSLKPDPRTGCDPGVACRSRYDANPPDARALLRVCCTWQGHHQPANTFDKIPTPHLPLPHARDFWFLEFIRSLGRRKPPMSALGQKRTFGHGYSMISSARASSEVGTVRPSAFAVFRFMMSSYLLGACTGRSAGFSPRNMRST